MPSCTIYTLLFPCSHISPAAVHTGTCQLLPDAEGAQATGVTVPLFTTWDPVAGSGEPQYLETFRAGADPGIILSVLVAQVVGRLGSDGFWEHDYGWGVRVRRHFGARGIAA